MPQHGHTEVHAQVCRAPRTRVIKGQHTLSMYDMVESPLQSMARTGHSVTFLATP
jgi:hypothetical protein